MSVPTVAEEALCRLDERERAFVLAYVGEAKGNGSEAVRRAGYSERGASVQATRLLKRATIRHALNAIRNPVTQAIAQVVAPESLAPAEKLAPEVIAQLRAVSEAVEEEAEQVAYTAANRAAVVDALMKIALGNDTETRYNKQGEPFEVRPPSAARVAAARALAAMEGWDAPVKAKIEHSGSIAATTEELDSLSDEQLAAELAQLQQRRAQALAN